MEVFMRVLVADDEPNLLSSISAFLQMETIESVPAPDGLVAKTLLAEESFDAALLDIRMPGLDGIDLLSWIKEAGFSLPVIMMSAHGDVRDAVEAMRLGACDYLVKPFDPDELVIRIRKAVRERRLSARGEAAHLPDSETPRMIGDSPAVHEALRMIEKAAPTPATVLISGESGTGKEVAARLIHEKSGRQGAFVAVNLGAIPETLMESELFGYEKGAFTGAADRKRGLFELADGGTLFLDEIGEMPQNMQVKILRALQERKVTRLGGIKGIPVDARIVAATNRNLETMVQQGTFREDLYYRINVVRIRLPPLRERPGDALSLVRHFVALMAPKMGRRSLRLSDDALSLIASYDFPGNIRELQNAVERAIILAEGDELKASDFQLGSGAASVKGLSSAGSLSNDEIRLLCPGGSFKGVDGQPLRLEELEKIAILAALERNGGKREVSAVELGITRRTLLNKLKEYGYEDSR
jgi:two-component system response regulator AtoC